MEAYIYGIKNKRNGKIYIGQTTTNIKKRIWYHKNRLIRNVHDNYLMQHDFNVAKTDFNKLFDYGVIETVDETNIINLNRIENSYIKKYGTYNIFSGSDKDYCFQKNKKTTKKQISEKRLLKKEQVYEILSLLYFFDNSVRPIARITQVNRTTVKSLSENQSYCEIIEDFNKKKDDEKWNICKKAIKKYQYSTDKITILPTLIKSLVLLLSKEYNISVRNIEKILNITCEIQRKIKKDKNIQNFYSAQKKDFLEDVFETVFNQSCAELRKYSKKVQRPVSPINK